MDRKEGFNLKEQKEFIKYYLCGLYEYNDLNKINDKQINDLLECIDYGCMLSSFFWGIWGIIETQRMEIGGWDYCEYSRVRLKDFFDLRMKYVNHQKP